MSRRKIAYAITLAHDVRRCLTNGRPGGIVRVYTPTSDVCMMLFLMGRRCGDMAN